MCKYIGFKSLSTHEQDTINKNMARKKNSIYTQNEMIRNIIHKFHNRTIKFQNLQLLIHK